MGPTSLQGYFQKPPHLVAFYDMLGIWGTHSRLNPWGPHRALVTLSESTRSSIRKSRLSSLVVQLTWRRMFFTTLSAWSDVTSMSLSRKGLSNNIYIKYQCFINFVLNSYRYLKLLSKQKVRACVLLLQFERLLPSRHVTEIHAT